MSPEVAMQAVCKVLQDVQAKQSFECPPLTGATKPLRDLPYFTSDSSIGATGMVAKELKITIPPKVNIFGDESGLFTLDKTIAILCGLAGEKDKDAA